MRVSLGNASTTGDIVWKANGSLGGYEKYNKQKVIMIPVKDRKQNTLIPLIQKWIHPGSIIHSDCWKSYNKLPKLGYTHVTVNHSKEFLSKENAASTNGIESDWHHAKVLIPHYGVHRGMHSGYLAEFMWRRKHMDEDKFIQLITDINAAFQNEIPTAILLLLLRYFVPLVGISALRIRIFPLPTTRLTLN